MTEEEDAGARGAPLPPVGTYTIEHWGELAAHRLHRTRSTSRRSGTPLSLCFHVPIQGAGTSIAELFALGRVEGAGSVGLDAYDWEYFEPLREGVPYRSGGARSPRSNG